MGEFRKYQQLRLDPSSYSFASGWKNNKFDPMRLTKEERKYWAEILGATFSLISNGREDRNVLTGYPWDKKQVEFYKTRLDDGIDFKVRKGPGQMRMYPRARQTMTIATPAILEYFESPLPRVDRETQEAILSGVLSNTLLRDFVTKDGKIIHTTKTHVVAESVRELSDLAKLFIVPLDWVKVVQGSSGKEKLKGAYSTWFLDPNQVKNYALGELVDLSVLDRMPDWTQDLQGVLLENTLFRRGVTWEKLRVEGRLTLSEFRTRMNEYHVVQEELDKLEPKILELKRKRIDAPEDQRDQIEARWSKLKERKEELSNILFERKRKGRFNGYGRAQAKYQKAVAREESRR